MKVALVHDWLTGMRGGEKVLERLCAMFPGAPIHTLVWNPGSVSAEIESHPIRTSFLQRLPGATQRYRWFLPLFPRAIEAFDLSGFDVVVSSSHAVAKGVQTGPNTFHLSYVHTPMRYVWDQEAEYFPTGRFPWPVAGYVRRVCADLRHWDVATSHRPSALVANSAHVAERIRRHWGRPAEVVHPPVEVVSVANRPVPPGPRDYYLLAGAMAPYKRGEVAVQACRMLDRPLVVAGSGPEEATLRHWAGRRTTFLGWVSDDRLRGLYAGARALLYPGEEDFGIVPVEAMAGGCPVVAYGRGGVLETVGRGASAEALATVDAGGVVRVPGGVLFGTRNGPGMAEAIRRLEETPCDRAALRELARPFDTPCFDRRFREVFDRAFAAWRAGRGGR